MKWEGLVVAVVETAKHIVKNIGKGIGKIAVVVLAANLVAIPLLLRFAALVVDLVEAPAKKSRLMSGEPVLDLRRCWGQTRTPGVLMEHLGKKREGEKTAEAGMAYPMDSRVACHHVRRKTEEDHEASIQLVAYEMMV
jgi:hypothetical protein